MSKKTHTKRALLSSVIALILCCAMLLGTTFAWFTDTASTKPNTIQSGNLDVVLEYKTSVDGEWAPVTEDTKLFKAGALYEPGYTEVVFLRISNAGSLALKYNLNVNVYDETTSTNIDGETFSLKDYLEIGYYTMDESLGQYLLGTMFGTREAALSNVTTTKLSAYNGVVCKDQPLPKGDNFSPQLVALVLTMPTTVDNEANHMTSYAAPTIDLGVTLIATQYTDETDSFGSDYDKDAKYEIASGLSKENGKLVAYTPAGLSSASELASEDESITSVSYVTDEGNVEVPVVRDTASMNAQLAEGESTIVLTEGTYTVGSAAGKTVTLVGSENTKVDVTSGLTYVNGANVTFEGLTIQSAPEGAGYTNGLADANNAVFNNCVIDGTLGLDFSCEFNNCEFNIEGDYYNVWTWGAGTATFNDCTFNCDGKALLVYANVLDNGSSHQTVNINGCVFNDNGDDTITGKAAIEITDTYPANNITYDVIINNTTVNGFSVTTKNATTFGGTELGTNVWGNKNLLTTADLNVVIDGVDVH